MRISWRTILGLAHTFGGVLAFQLVLWRFGVKPAIAAGLAFLAADGAWRLARRQPLPRVWLLANGLTVIFGMIDLWAKTPFMLRYEGAIGNVIFGFIFLAGSRGPRPVVMDYAEQSLGRPLPTDRPELIAYFRVFTLLWAGYCFARAAMNVWLVSEFPLPQALALRSVIGTASLGVMLAISFSGRRGFALCQRLGFFRPRAARAETAIPETKP